MTLELRKAFVSFLVLYLGWDLKRALDAPDSGFVFKGRRVLDMSDEEQEAAALELREAIGIKS